MQQQIQKLKGLATAYKKLEKDKKKTQLKTIDYLLELNQQIRFDEVLIRSGYAAYPKRQELEAKKTEQTCQAFFKYMAEKINEIESNYLRDTNDAKLIEQAEATNQNQYNFLLNKNSVSKFIRDEAAHYQKIMQKYLEANHEAEDEKGIKTTKMHTFLIDLFTSKHSMIIRQGEEYLKRPISQIQIDVGNHLLQYGKKCKQMSEQKAKQEYFISEEQILDFLTFWLREEPKIFILYARTEDRLAQQSKLILNQSHLTAIVHPSRMTSLQIIKRSQEVGLTQNEPLDKSQILQIKQQIVTSQTPIPQVKVLESQTASIKIQNFNFQNPQKQEIRPLQVVQEKRKKEISKEEMLRRQMKGLFEFGCKKRYKVNKNTTFEDISEESKSMNLQKFVYFCNFFELTSFLTRDVIVQYFKVFAINHRILDFSGFQKAIEKMVQIDAKIADNLLKKSTFQIKQKRNHIDKDKKSQVKLSSYKFILHPINGKDVSSIQKELTFRKLEKMIVRQEKQKLALNKREQYEKAPSKIGSRIVPSYSSSRVSPAELQPIRDNTFNPQKLISNGENDKLWDAYEAKIWNKDQRSHSTLESILTKRIQRGNVVINKLNSQRSFIYDQ